MKKWFPFLNRAKSERPAPRKNRTLTDAEVLARQAQTDTAEPRPAPKGPNHLRTSEENRAKQRERREERRKNNQIGGLIREVISGEILAREALVRQVPFLIYVCFLTLLYVALGYQTERILRQKQHVQDKLEEAVSEEKTLRAEFESELQQSKLQQSTAALGLGQPTEPPTLISAAE